MKRTDKHDPWFNKQPQPDFIDELRTPVHTAPPAGFGRRTAAPGEVCVTGLWIDNRFPDPQGLLVSVVEDFDRFVCLCRFEGESFSIRLEEGPTPCLEAYTIRVSKAGIVVTAADTEGVRRALIWMEDEMRRREGPYLPLGRFERRPFIQLRLTRSIFSAVHTAADDYPEEYLGRLMHDGINGVWLYADEVNGTQNRVCTDGLNRIAEKCARYGIRVYVCVPEEDAGRLFEQCPELGGTIVIDGDRVLTRDGETLLWEPEDCLGIMATVPYMPVPGILYKAYAAARERGAAGVMLCRDRGCWPSVMSRAAGELAFEDSLDDETGFLRRIAGVCWGNSRADTVVKAWQLFEKACRQSPADGMFSGAGLLHDAPVRGLGLTSESDGDDVMAAGFAPEDALAPVGRMCTYWNAGLRALDTLEILDEERQEQWSVAHTVGILLESARNVLEFYRLRELLVQGIKPEITRDSMRSVVEDEIRHSKMLALLSVQDGRIGYHPGQQAYSFFPEKLAGRVEQLEELLRTGIVQENNPRGV